jgi:hypothetical protein
VAVDRQALRLGLHDRRVPDRRDTRYVWNRHRCVKRCGLVCDNDRSPALDRDDFTTLHVFGRSLLRRADEHAEEQYCEQRMQSERREEAPR